jgi:multisubunit Na+/H+ antiporter MnhE subunit
MSRISKGIWGCKVHAGVGLCVLKIKSHHMNKLNYRHFGVAFLVAMVLRVVLPNFSVNSTDEMYLGIILGLVAFVSFIAMVVSCVFEIVRDRKYRKQFQKHEE